MARSHKKRSKTLTEFAIPSVRKDMDEETWRSSENGLIWYGIPEENRYRHPNGGRYKRCRIPVFDSTERPLGYVSLPSRYKPAWVALCKNIAFRLCEWKLWIAESKKESPEVPEDVCTELRRDSGTKLLQYMVIRRMIVEELMTTEMGKGGKDELDVFDEYLIRDAYDWLWTDIGEVPEGEEFVLGLDPVDKSNEDVFVSNYLPDKVHDSQEWTRGLIPGYEEGWHDSMPALVELVRDEKHRGDVAERPWMEGEEAPSVWHEGQEPMVKFLSEEEDALTATRGGASSDRQMGDAQEQDRSSPRRTAGSNEGGEAQVEEGEDGSAPETDEAEQDELMAYESEEADGPHTPPGMVIDPAILAEEHAAFEQQLARLDNPTTRQAVVDYAEGKIEIPAAEERIREALGQKYDYVVWGKAIQQVYREAEEEGERGKLTVDEMFSQCIAPEQQRLDNLDQMRSRKTRL